MKVKTNVRAGEKWGLPIWKDKDDVSTGGGN